MEVELKQSPQDAKEPIPVKVELKQSPQDVKKQVKSEQKRPKDKEADRTLKTPTERNPSGRSQHPCPRKDLSSKYSA